MTEDRYTHDYGGRGGVREKRLNMFHIRALKEYLNVCRAPTNTK